MRRTTETTTILGVDAAWTAPKPSGVALVQRTTDGWRCVTAAPSYDDFYGAAAGREIRWETSGRCCAPPNLSLCRRLVSEIDREIRTTSRWMDQEKHDHMRDGYRERVAALERERAEIGPLRSV